MLWLFRRVLDRLVVRVVGVVATQIESHAQMELSETRAELLRRAKELEHEDTPGVDLVAAELRSRAERIGVSAGPESEVTELAAELHGEDLRTGESLRLASERQKPRRIKTSNGRKRGRRFHFRQVTHGILLLRVAVQRTRSFVAGDTWRLPKTAG